jgi:hypothetical protein
VTPAVRILSDFVDPTGAMLGFLVPLFSDGRSNAPLVQVLAADGTIRRFEPNEVPEAPRLPAPHVVVRDGDHGVHAFAFGPHDIVVVAGSEDLEQLTLRIDDPVLLERPMLAIELAAFLRRDDLLIERAVEVHERLRLTSRSAADTWRDLSVLTTGLRRRLGTAGHRASRRLASSIVATAREGVIELAGLPGTVEPARVEELKVAVAELLDEFVALYPRPADGWRLRLTPVPPRRGLESDAAVLVLAEQAVSRDWRPVLDLRLFGRNGPEFARVVEDTKAPLFVAYEGEHPDQMRRARGDWTVRDMHGLAIGSSTVAARAAAERHPWRTTHVVAPGIRATGAGRDRAVLAALELAIAAELERVNADLSWPVDSAILLRAQGTGPDARSDGWAALYDRSWSMGLAPWQSLCLMPSGEDATIPISADWAAHALLQAERAIRGPLIDRVMAMSRATAAMLVDLRPRTSDDFFRHRRAMVQLLERQHWSTADLDRGDRDTAIRITGSRGNVDVRFAEPMGRKRSEEHHPEDRAVPDLRRLKGLVVTCGASPASTRAQLRASNELSVDARDLIGMDPRTTTPLSVVGHQLRRMVMGLHSPSRTRLLALVVRQAFEFGRVDAFTTPALAKAIDDPELGSRLHLTVRAASQVEGATVAQMRLVDQTTGRTSRHDPSGTFRMIVTPDEVILEDRPPR